MKIIWAYFYSLSSFEPPSFLQYTLIFKYKPKIKRKKCSYVSASTAVSVLH